CVACLPLCVGVDSIRHGMEKTVQVRRAASGDEPTLRALRLAAMTESPGAFASTLAREQGRTTEDWQRWISPGVTVLLYDGNQPPGLVAGVRDTSDQTVVHLMAMWVHPAMRGTGAADALVTSVIDWAVEQSAREIRLHIAKGNDRASRCYERHGFRITGRE